MSELRPAAGKALARDPGAYKAYKVLTAFDLTGKEGGLLIPSCRPLVWKNIKSRLWLSISTRKHPNEFL